MAQTIALIAIVEDEYELTENTQIIKSYSFVIQGKSSFRTEFTSLLPFTTRTRRLLFG